MSHVCCTLDELTAFHTGEMPDYRLESVAAHIDTCARCADVLRELDTCPGPFLDRLRRAHADVKPAATPHVIGPYEVVRELGRGGMGIVYEARHTALDRPVALKVLARGRFDPEGLTRFRHEARAIAALQHPNVVPIYDSGEFTDDVGPTPYYAMELVTGGSLAIRWAGRPQPPRTVAEWLEPLARAVHHAHAAGIVHRDIKPSNVLVAADGRPLLCDFGIASRYDPDNPRTVTDAVIGTVEYMAPEQALGQRVGPAADVYSLGALLYTALVGRPPFQAATALKTLDRVRSEPPVPPRRLQPGVPRDLEAICLACLEKSPSARYPSAAALANDLRRFLNGRPTVVRPPGPARRVAKWMCRRPFHAAAAAVAIGATALAVGGVWYHVETLREEVKATRAAERRAQENAATAVHRRDVALRALDKLVNEVQDELRDKPGVAVVRERLLREAIRGLEELAGDPDARSVRASQTIAELYFDMGSFTEARLHFERALGHADEWLRLAPTDPEAKRLWCRARLRFAELCVSHSHPRARELAAEILPFAEAWAASEPGSAQARFAVLAGRELAVSLDLLLTKQHSATLKQYESLHTVLADTPADSPDEFVELHARVALGLALARVVVEGHVTADAAAADAQRWRELLLQRRPKSVRRAYDVALVTDTRQVLAAHRGDWPAACGHARRTVELLAAVAKANPDYPRYQHDRGTALMRLGIAERKCGNAKAAESALSEAKRVFVSMEATGAAPPQNRAFLAEIDAHLRALTGAGQPTEKAPDNSP